MERIMTPCAPSSSKGTAVPSPLSENNDAAIVRIAAPGLVTLKRSPAYIIVTTIFSTMGVLFWLLPLEVLLFMTTAVDGITHPAGMLPIRAQQRAAGQELSRPLVWEAEEGRRRGRRELICNDT